MASLLDLDDAVNGHPLAALELGRLKACRSELLSAVRTSEENLSSLIAALALVDGGDRVTLIPWRDYLRTLINKHGLES